MSRKTCQNKNKIHLSNFNQKNEHLALIIPKQRSGITHVVGSSTHWHIASVDLRPQSITKHERLRKSSKTNDPFGSLLFHETSKTMSFSHNPHWLFTQPPRHRKNHPFLFCLQHGRHELCPLTFQHNPKTWHFSLEHHDQRILQNQPTPPSHPFLPQNVDQRIQTRQFYPCLFT